MPETQDSARTRDGYLTWSSALEDALERSAANIGQEAPVFAPVADDEEVIGTLSYHMQCLWVLLSEMKASLAADVGALKQRNASSMEEAAARGSGSRILDLFAHMSRIGEILEPRRNEMALRQAIFDAAMLLEHGVTLKEGEVELREGFTVVKVPPREKRVFIINLGVGVDTRDPDIEGVGAVMTALADELKVLLPERLHAAGIDPAKFEVCSNY